MSKAPKKRQKQRHKPAAVPSYRLHKPSGRAVVRLGGKDYYLGKYDSPESHAEYRRLIAEFLAAGGKAAPRVGTELLVSELAVRYWEFCKTYYVKCGRPTKQQGRIRACLDRLLALYDATPVDLFGPLALQAVRQKMIEDQWVRRYINQCIGCIKRMFKWGVAQQIVSPSVYQGLAAVDGLRVGRTAAPESPKVLPVPEEYIEPAIAEMSPTVAAMVRVQLHTGLRPGEVCAIRPCDVDRSGAVWIYTIRPEVNKAGGEGTAFIGPKGQEALRPFLLRDAHAYCFSPKEAAEWCLKRDNRKVKLSKRRPPGDRYDAGGYCHSIKYACRRAFLAPPKLMPQKGETRVAWRKRLSATEKKEVAAWQKAHTWHPHQLRHNAGTRIRAEFGPDVARAVLRHRSLQATEIYAELDLEKAKQAMGRVG